MKVKQIVGEHKKGVRAKIYTKKPQNTIAPAKPKKPEGPVSEDAKITKSDTTGVEITADDGVKTTLPPEKAAALTPDPSNPNEYDLNPTTTSPTGDTQTGPKVGANVEIKTAEAVSDDLSTMPTDEYVKGIYAAAAENGMDAPEAEAVKKQMVLAPNGEVDIMATMQKALQAFQSPEFKQMLADLDALVKQAEAQQAANPELARIQELAGTAVPAPMPAAEEPMQSPEQIKYNQLRAQWDSYQAMTDSGPNTFVSKDPVHDAKLQTIPAELARMAAALKAKGIDAEADYAAIGGPKSAPVDINQKYATDEAQSNTDRMFKEELDAMLRIAKLR
jgi:hypothetical protein